MNIAVIFAGGVGSRMKARDIPKQFLKIHGKEVIAHTIEKFQNHPLVNHIVVVCVPGWLEYCKDIIEKYSYSKVGMVVPGGESGQLSIYNGLVAAKEKYGVEDSIVLIHDGVRPLIDSKTITDNIASVRAYGSAITTIPAKESVLITGSEGVKEIPERSSIRIAKAPQSFYLKDIISAHEKAMDEQKFSFVDSASLMKFYGHEIFLVEGEDNNIKITTQDDYFAVQAIFNSVENEQLRG